MSAKFFVSVVRAGVLFFCLDSSCFATIIDDFDLVALRQQDHAPVPLASAKRISIGSCVGSLQEMSRSLGLNRQGLGLVPGQALPYPRGSGLRKIGVSRLGQLYVRAERFDVIEKLIRLISRGSFLSPHEVRARIASAKTEAGLIPLAALLPDFVAKELNRKAPYNGPNCFNTVCRFHSRNELQSETYDYEMTDFLRSQFRPLREGEKPSFGDVLVFWSAEGKLGRSQTIRHVAIYLDETYVLHKASLNERDPITFQTVDELFGYYLKTESPMILTVHRRLSGKSLAAVN